MSDQPDNPKPDNQPVPVFSFEDVRRVCSEPLRVAVQISGQPFSLELRRLNPAEQALIEYIHNDSTGASGELLPPRKAGVGNDPGEYDFEDPKYREELGLKKRAARALAVFHGWPSLKAGLNLGAQPAREAVMAAVEESPVPAAVLDYIATAVMGGGLEVIQRVNFTSANASAPS